MLVVLAAVLTSCATADDPAGPSDPIDPADPGTWFHPDWSHRVALTVSDVSLPSSGQLEAFPVLVDGSSLGDVWSLARSDGGDLVVTAADGRTVVPHEVVGFDPGRRTAEIWFRAPQLASDQREFFLYFGNSGASASPDGSVWNGDYVAVYHFDDDPGAGVLSDATAAGNHGRADQPNSNWTSGDVGSGKIGQGWSFNGTSHYINTNRISTLDGTFTVSAWLLHTTRSTDFFFQSNPGFWQIASQASDQSNHSQFKDGSVEVRFEPNTIVLNEFHHFAFVFDEAARKVTFYYDGTPSSTLFFWPPETDPDDYYVGYPMNPDGPAGNDLVGILGPMYWNNLDLMNGIGDEFRVNDSALSADWIAAEHANQADPGAFISPGALERAPEE